MVHTRNQRRSSPRRAVQRVDDDNRVQADRTPGRPAPTIEDLADRVYRLMVEDLRRSQEREW